MGTSAGVVEATTTPVGDAVTVGDVPVGNSVGVSGRTPAQNCPSNSFFEAEYRGEEVVNFSVMLGCLNVPSGHV